MTAGPLLIVEDHELLAQSLSVSLRGDGVDVAVTAGPTAEDVLEAARSHGAGLVLLDLDLGEVMGDGLDLVAPLVRLGATVVILTGNNDRLRHAECLEAGALGVLHKGLSYDGLLEAIGKALRTGELTPQHQRQEMLAELRRQRLADEERLAVFDRLTRREEQVLSAVMDGQSADAIAADWVVSVATVRSQIRSLLVKLGVNSQLSAVALARRAGWQPDE